MTPPIIVLAGGLATRLRPVTSKIPKALLPVAGEPFIAHQLRLFAKAGLSDVVLSVGYLGEQVESFVGDGARYGLRVRYSYDGPTLLGTGGAVKKAAALVGDVFYVIYGDSYLETDFLSPLNYFQRTDAGALMTVLRNEGRWEVSNIHFEKGWVRDYHKTQHTSEMKHTDYGLLIFRKEALSDVSSTEPSDLALFLSRLGREGKLAGFEVYERFYEIGSPVGLAETEKHLANKK